MKNNIDKCKQYETLRDEGKDIGTIAEIMQIQRDSLTRALRRNNYSRVDNHYYKTETTGAAAEVKIKAAKKVATKTTTKPNTNNTNTTIAATETTTGTKEILDYIKVLESRIDSLERQIQSEIQSQNNISTNDYNNYNIGKIVSRSFRINHDIAIQFSNYCKDNNKKVYIEITKAISNYLNNKK